MRYILLLAVFVFFVPRLDAQETSRLDGYSIEVNLLAGKLIKHNYIFPPIPALSTGIDISIMKQTDGRKEWQQRRNYPKIGLGLTYTNYGDNNIFGQCIGIYPVIPWQIVKGRKLEWHLKFGMGVGYVTRHYNRQPTWDTINNLIGSHLNNFTIIASDVRYNITPHFSVKAGITLTHISNGSFKLPNLGLNLATGHIGICYTPGNGTPKRIVRDLKPLKNRWLLQARMGFGFSELQGNNGPLYPVYMPSLFVSRRYGGRNKMFAGVDYTYYASLYAFMRNNEIHPGKEVRYASQASVFVGNEFLMGRFGLVTQLCIPFMHTDRPNEGKYQLKLGYNFYLLKTEQGPLKELSLHSYIKSNKFEADVIEFGIGVGL